MSKCRRFSPASYKALRTYMRLDLKYGACESAAEDVCTWYVVSEHEGKHSSHDIDSSISASKPSIFSVGLRVDHFSVAM